MKKSKLLLLSLLLSFGFPAILSAQAITADLELFVPDPAIIFLGDLNLINLEKAPLLFSITIKSNAETSIDLTLHFGIKRDDQTLIDGKTLPFLINPGQIIYLTSQNVLAEEDKYSIQNIEITNATKELKNTILAQGKLPTGVYKFFVELEYETQPIAYDEVEITVNISTTLDLISPGQPAESGELMEIYTTLPFFQWHSTARQFRITVCEKLAINTSPQDVMNNEPRMQQIVENYTFLQYPSSGVWPLEEGKTYYWQIVAITESSSGPVELESEIWGFKIGNTSGGVSSIYHQQLLNLLLSFLGDGDLRSLFENGGELENFTFTGVMFNNDRVMTMEDLIAIIEQILSSKIIIDRFVVE